MTIPENKKIKDTLRKYPWLYRIISFLRPPNPKFDLIGHRKRQLFSQIIINAGLTGYVLDIGSGPLKNGNLRGLSAELFKRRLALDYVKQPGIDFIANADNLPLKDNCMAGVLSQGVIEHIKDPIKVTKETYRVLKPGGTIYVEAPFLQHFHYDPIDFYRFTTDGLSYLYRDFKKIECGVLYGPSAVLADVLTEYFAVFFKSALLYWGIKWFLGWITLPLKYIDFFLIKRPRSKYLCLGIYYLGKKADEAHI